LAVVLSFVIGSFVAMLGSTFCPILIYINDCKHDRTFRIEHQPGKH
jgi:hypothetical protein